MIFKKTFEHVHANSLSFGFSRISAYQLNATLFVRQLHYSVECVRKKCCGVFEGETSKNLLERAKTQFYEDTQKITWTKTWGKVSKWQSVAQCIFSVANCGLLRLHFNWRRKKVNRSPFWRYFVYGVWRFDTSLSALCAGEFSFGYRSPVVLMRRRCLDGALAARAVSDTTEDNEKWWSVTFRLNESWIWAHMVCRCHQESPFMPVLCLFKSILSMCSKASNV